MALVSNSKYGSAVELAAASAPSTDVALYAKAAGDGQNAHMVLKAHTASFTGDVHVTGTLHVEGTINSTNRNETNLIIEDKTMTVASGSNEAATDGAGLNFGGSADSPIASLLFEADSLGGSSHHLLSSTGFKATGELHGTTISGSGPIKTADAIEAVGNMRTEGNVTAEGNLAAVAGNLTVGSYGLTNAGAATIASMAGNWTNAGRTVADMGTVTTMDLDGGTADNVVIGGATPAAGTFTALVAEGNVDLGNATSDTITATGRFDSNLVPSTDSARSLGTSALQWQEIHVDTGNIDQLGSALDCNSQAMTNVDINSGNIDGAAIGANDASSGAFTTLSANGNVTLGDAATDSVNVTASFNIRNANYGYEVFKYDNAQDYLGVATYTYLQAAVTASNGMQINYAHDAAVAFKVDADDGDVTVSTELTASNGLTVASQLVPSGDNAVDLGASGAQFKDLHLHGIGYIDQLGTDADPSAAYINSGEIDGAVIGGESAAAGTFTTLTANDQLVVAAGATITGDTTNEITLAVKGVGSQTANLLVVEQNDGTDKLSVSAAGVTTAASLVATTADINGGTIDGITSLTAAGDLDIGAHGFRAATLTADTMTSGRVAIYGANGVLSEDSDLTFSGDTLTVTKLGAFEAAGAIDFSDEAMTNVNIDSGAIDGATLGANSQVTVTDADINGGTLSGVTVDGSLTWSAAQNLNSQALTNVNIDSGDISAATISGGLTWSSAQDLNNQALTNVNVDGGAIDGTAIGAASRSSVACTTLDANGNVTLGDASSDTVTINGTVGNFTAGTITGTEFIATSDARLKTNIQGVTNAMDVINSIQGVEYELTENGQHSMGVLAQDLIEVAPALVKTRENGNYAVNYSGLSAFFVEAIKEQQAQIEDLKNTVKELSK